ncbi:proteasome subunit beta type-5-like [Drosophila tropicalis]|uniref:proteasome subunit beta type-5-like n=1 Tax=Drosophila tropicalis TaxID=46794 RepID=UPI0035ABD669
MALEGICGMNKLDFATPYEILDHGQRNQAAMGSINFQNPFKLVLPPTPYPFGNINKLFEKTSTKINVTSGTTTLGFIFQGGIVLCADSRGTSDTFIGSNEVEKIIEISDHLLGTMAGCAADCWDRVLMRECRLYELRFKRKLPVRAAARMICNTAFHMLDMGLSMGMMLAGWGPKGPQLAYVDSDGERLYGSNFVVGSGSLAAMGVFDVNFHFDMTNEEAFTLAERALYHATYSDSYTGGLVRVYHITKDGWKKISCTDSVVLHERFKNFDNQPTLDVDSKERYFARDGLDLKKRPCTIPKEGDEDNDGNNDDTR